MIHSTWDDWLVRSEIEATNCDCLSIWYLGCNAFVVRSPEATIYIDPYFGDGDPPNIVRMIPVPMDPADATVCDAVVVTHEHIDHMHPPSYAPLVNDLDADLYAPQASYEESDYEGDLQAPSENRQTISEGESFDIGDVTVHVLPANDPDAIEPVSYLFEHESGTFFHGGDSRPSDAFEDVAEMFDVDVGAFAFGTVGNIYYPEDDETRPTRWYMDENQIIEAANQLEVNRLVPSHYDMWRGLMRCRRPFTSTPVRLRIRERSKSCRSEIESMSIARGRTSSFAP